MTVYKGERKVFVFVGNNKKFGLLSLSTTKVASPSFLTNQEVLQSFSGDWLSTWEPIRVLLVAMLLLATGSLGPSLNEARTWCPC